MFCFCLFFPPQTVGRRSKTTETALDKTNQKGREWNFEADPEVITGKLILTQSVEWQNVCFAAHTACHHSLAFQRLKLIHVKHYILSTITDYKCPSVKYCIHCCSSSGPPICSVPRSKDQPHRHTKMEIYSCATKWTFWLLSILGHYEHTNEHFRIWNYISSLSFHVLFVNSKFVLWNANLFEVL